MGLDELDSAVESAGSELGETVTIELTQEMQQELGMLMAVLDADAGDLIERAVHLLFQSAVDTAKLDFHLRQEFDVMYDEYLSGMTFDEMTGGNITYPQPDDERRYQF